MGTASVSPETCGDDNLSMIHPSIRRELACVDRQGVSIYRLRKHNSSSENDHE